MRVLLVTYYFPPYNAVGAIRPGKFAKFLHKQGHELHVLTADAPPFPIGLPIEIPTSRIHCAPSWSINAPVQLLLGGREKVARQGFSGAAAERRWLKRLGKWYKTLLHWPDAEMGWVRSAIRLGKRLLSQHRFDVIYVSAPPFSALRVGNALSRIGGTPWIAEFRDLWTCNHTYQHPRWRRGLERLWEYRLLRSASALVTVSPPLAENLRKFGLPVWEIRNGFDPEDLDGIEPLNMPNDSLNIVYTGSVYPEFHDTSVFCEGLSNFLVEGGKAKVMIVGRNVTSLLDQAKRFNVDHVFEVGSTVARKDAIALQCSADALLFFLWNGGNQGIYTTKLFEYAAARRQIVAVGTNMCDVATLIQAERIGVVALSSRQVAETLHALWEQKEERGSLEPNSLPALGFSRDSQFALLESHICSLVKSRA